MTDSAYDLDFYAWANAQADAARRRSANEIDWENVAEELDGLGKQQEWELFSRYVVLLTHLLKWRHQPGRRGASWEVTIKQQRLEMAKLIRRAPSLQSVEADEFADGYASARLQAARETRLSEKTFPVEPPFTAHQARDPNFWPEPAKPPAEAKRGPFA